MDNKRLIAQRISSALAMRDKKQKELAHAIGVTDNTISYFCNGNRTPNLQQIVAIAKALDVSTDYLLGKADLGNSTTDEQLRMISEYTGLSNDAVSRLHDLSHAYIDLLSLILSDEGLEYLLGLLEGYFAEDNGITAANQKDLAIFTASNAIRLILERIAPEFIKRYNESVSEVD